MSVPLLLSSVVEFAPPGQETWAKLTMLDDPLARCMDGSLGGFYLAANKSSNSWVIELQGGGVDIVGVGGSGIRH